MLKGDEYPEKFTISLTSKITRKLLTKPVLGCLNYFVAIAYIFSLATYSAHLFEKHIFCGKFFQVYYTAREENLM